MADSYRFVSIETVTPMDMTNRNVVIINHEGADNVIYQPINCNTRSFLSYITKQRKIKLVKTHKGVYMFSKTNVRSC